MKDRVFEEETQSKFDFDANVASVFDDMLKRSVPFYTEVVALIVELVLKNSKVGDRIYDLGCSTAEVLLGIAQAGSDKRELIGIDNSKPMVEQAQKKIAAYGADIEVLFGDILGFEYKKASIFISNYTLQFIRPINRTTLIKKIYNALEDDGIFIFSEKVISEDKILDKQLIDIYHDYKIKQGYSKTEIARKREALENVLVPYSDKENQEMIRNAGFTHVDVIFRWANFATYLARR